MATKTVLITGCSQGGIGAALAMAFARKGHKVFATLRNTSKAGKLASEPNVDIVALDVVAESSIQEALKTIQSRLPSGKLDILINNAGGGYMIPVLDMDIDQAKQLYDVNVWGIVRVVQAFAPLLIAARGTVLNITSVASFIPMPYSAVYNSSKAAATMVSESLRLEMAPFNVTVRTGMIAAVESEFQQNDAFTSLPPESYYISIEDKIRERANASGGVKPQPVSVFAENVVRDVLSTSSGRIWRGTAASVCRWIFPRLPGSVQDYLAVKDSGLDVLKRNLQASTKLKNH